MANNVTSACIEGRKKFFLFLFTYKAAHVLSLTLKHTIGDKGKYWPLPVSNFIFFFFFTFFVVVPIVDCCGCFTRNIFFFFCFFEIKFVVIADFGRQKKIIFSDEAHFDLGG